MIPVMEAIVLARSQERLLVLLDQLVGVANTTERLTEIDATLAPEMRAVLDRLREVLEHLQSTQRVLEAKRVLMFGEAA